MNQFDKTYWENQWAKSPVDQERRPGANPYLPTETAQLTVGTALDAGCGAGAEAIWLAEHGWQVTAADIAGSTLALARRRAEESGASGCIEWVEADLVQWEPAQEWDLVVTSYAHAEIGQLALYQRLAAWVRPGGTMLIIGHLSGDGHGHRSTEHPEDATITLDSVTGLFSGPEWHIGAGYENTRELGPGSHRAPLRDVVVRAHRSAPWDAATEAVRP